MQYLNEHTIFIFLVQIVLLLGAARALGELFRRHGQPSLTAEILVGVVLGPTILGRFLPQLHQLIFPPDIIQQSMLETVAWLGVLFLLLETGLEVDFSAAWRQRGDALVIALTDIIVPLVIGFIVCFFLPAHYLVDPNQRILFAAFMATAMMISAMPTVARALHDLRLSKTDLGFLIVSALSVNDIIGWLIFTLVLGLFTQTTLPITKIIMIPAATVAFTFFCMTLGRRFTNYVITKMQDLQMPQPGSSLTFIVVLGLCCGAITQKIGIHALFGFFVAGIMAGEARALSERTRQVIAQMVYALFVPVFFATIGLKVDFFKNFDIALVVLVTTIGISGRFLGAWLGAGLVRSQKENRLLIAITHTPGGVMEIVVGIFALEYHLITEPVFVAIVFAAVVSSMMLGPWLSYALKRRQRISVLEFFSARAVLSPMNTHLRDDAIRKLCDIAAEQEGLAESNVLYEAVAQRENSMGTALEEGVAVPHGRLPFIKRPVVIFGRSLSGIEWNSPDGKPTNFIFLILTPLEGDVQVQILGAIARTLSDKRTRDAIMAARDSREIWSVLQAAFASENIRKE